MEHSRNTSTANVVFFLLALALFTFANSLEAKETSRPLSTSDLKILAHSPIANTGHGAFFDGKGQVVELSEKTIYQAQKYWLAQLKKRSRPDRKTMALMEEIQTTVENSVLASSLMIDVLSQRKNDAFSQRAFAINHAIRLAYLEAEKITASKNLYGISDHLLRRFTDMGLQPLFVTDEEGKEYIEQCREAGVPIPPPMYSRDWENRGEFNTEFISEGLTAELWLYESESPAGACLALPRYKASDPNTADLLGLICLGRETSKACFWDNPRGDDGEWPRNVERPIEDFIGGEGLVANNQGTCTDCHAGENPFVVHPDVKPFQGLTAVLSSDDWYEPIVAAGWPQNPGPMDISSIDSTERCDSCHNKGYAGRFPDLTAGLTGYCGAVLRTSLLGDTTPPVRAIQTMPQTGSFAGHFNHIDHLLSLCYGGTTPGGDDDDREQVSPPIVLGPLYACATQVAVGGTILDAEVSLYIDGALIETKISRSPSQLVFDVPDLQVGQIVTAEQVVNGMNSGFSDPVEVRDHKADYPGGLPAPDIDPDLIYECGYTVAVRHVPGAKLTVSVNGGDERTIATSVGRTGMYPGKTPFDLNDEFVAEISLCEDKSPPSSPEYAVAAPAVTNTPTLDPAQTYEGQELITLRDILHGSMVTVDEASTGTIDKFSTPIDLVWERDIATQLGRPLQNGDQLLLQQHLCESGPVGETPPTEPCDDLPAPKIQIPFVGDTQVVVTSAVPGARIRIFAGGLEIGDGSGNVIALTRALVDGDVLTVTQQVGECFSREAYRIQVFPRPVRRDEKRKEDRG